MPREGKHKKTSKPHRQRSAKPQRVLRYAALGKSSKLARLFTESLPSDLGLFDSEGNTALHLAAQHGHKDTAALLVRCASAAVLCCSRFTRCWLLPASLLPLLSEAHLSLLCRQGAECKAENFAGNTPAHLAAMHGHAAILTILLQVRGGAFVCRIINILLCDVHSASTDLWMHMTHHLSLLIGQHQGTTRDCSPAAGPHACPIPPCTAAECGCVKAESPPDPAATNNVGVSIAQLTQALLGSHDSR